MENKNIMVCVTQQKTSERLILNGDNLVQSKNDKLYVIHVVNEKGMFLDHENDGEALEYLFKVSKDVGANLTVLRSKDILKAMVQFAKENKINYIVIGATPKGGKKQKLDFSSRLQKALPNVEFVIL